MICRQRGAKRSQRSVLIISLMRNIFRPVRDLSAILSRQKGENKMHRIQESFQLSSVSKVKHINLDFLENNNKTHNDRFDLFS